VPRIIRLFRAIPEIRESPEWVIRKVREGERLRSEHKDFAEVLCTSRHLGGDMEPLARFSTAG